MTPPVKGYISLGEYRGYDIGTAPTVLGYRVYHRDKLKNAFVEAHVLANDLIDAEKLSRQIVDYAYLIEAFEAENGIPYDAEKDGNLRK